MTEGESKILEVVLQLKDEVTGSLRKIAGESEKTGAKVATLQSRLERVATSMNRAGRSMSMYVTAPILAAGAASLKFSGDFERSFGQIEGLVGVSRSQLAEWKPEILALGAEMGRLPTEMADALYFITSAGIENSQAMDVLRQSAKAATAGLGETGVIADAVTSAINAYGAGNMSAARATDILVAAVKEGKVEADELAPVLGNVLPTAAAMGVSFEQIAGMLAVFSRTGVDAATGATQLNAVLSAMLSTSPKAVKALNSVGLSMEDLRTMAAQPNGLINVMRTLEDRLGGDEEKFATIIPNVRAFRGVMNALAQDSAIVDDVLAGVADSVGMTDKAFKAIADTKVFTWDQFKAQAQATAIVVGDELAPVLSELLKNDIIPLLEGIGKLDPKVLALGIKFLGVVAAIGPLLVVTSQLVTAVKVLSALKLPAWLLGGAAGKGGLALGARALAAGPVIAAIGTGIWVANMIKQGQEIDRQTIEDAKKTKEEVIAIWQAGGGREKGWKPLSKSPALSEEKSGVTGAQVPLQPIWDSIADWFTGLGEGQADAGAQAMLDKQLVGPVQSTADKVKTILAGLGEHMKGSLTNIFGGLGGIVSSGWNAVVNANKSALALIISGNQAAWEQVKSGASSAWNAIKTAVSTAVQGIVTANQNAWTQIKSLVSSSGQAIQSTMSTAWNAIKGVASSVWAAIVGVVQGAAGSIRTAIGGFTGWLSTTWSGIWNSLEGIVSTACSAVASNIATWVGKFRSALSGFWDWFTGHSMWPDMWAQVVAITGQATSETEGIVQGFLGTLQGAFKSGGGDIEAAVKTTMDSVRTQFKLTKEQAEAVETSIRNAAVQMASDLQTIKEQLAALVSFDGTIIRMRIEADASQAAAALEGMQSFIGQGLYESITGAKPQTVAAYSDLFGAVTTEMMNGANAPNYAALTGAGLSKVYETGQIADAVNMAIGNAGLITQGYACPPGG